MSVIIANATPPAIRGLLKRWFIEPRPNVFVGTVNRRTREIIEKSPYGIFVVNSSGTIAYLNQAMEKINITEVVFVFVLLVPLWWTVLRDLPRKFLIEIAREFRRRKQAQKHEGGIPLGTAG